LSMRFVVIGRRDTGALARLDSLIFGDTEPVLAEAVFRDCLEGAVRGGCLMALEGKEVAGAVFTDKETTFQGKGARIRSLFVSEKYRGKGVGKELLRRAVAAAGKAGCVSVSLSVEPGNKAAIMLYEKEGFAKTRLWYSKRL
jgi:ribosomal protein S18 acetylase RimI-like enzyme